MAKLLKLRRGTTSDHNSFTGAEGEVTVDTTKDTLVVHDGRTQGGHALAKASEAVATTGATFTGNVLIDNAQELRLGEADASGTNFTALKAQPQSADVTLTLPAVAPTANQILKADGSTPTTLTWAAETGVTLLDEDNFASDSATAAATQQSIKAYGAATYQPLDADLTSLAGCQSGAAGAIAALTQTEVEVLDGATVTTAELNILDGVTATAAELNILDGVTSTATELNLLDGVTATTAELNYTDGVTSNIQTQLNAKGTSNVSLSAANAWTASQRGKVHTITATSTLNIPLDSGQHFIITANGDGTLTFTDLDSDAVGQSGVIYFTNGAHTHSYASHVKKATAVTIGATAGDYIIPYTVIATDKVCIDVIAVG